MAADLHSPEPPLFPTETAAPPQPTAAEAHLPSTAGPATTIAPTATAHTHSDNPAQILAPKRQRRPSVRLGEIGDQPYESHPRRTKQQQPAWRLPRDSSSAKSVKARSLTNLVNGDVVHETDDNNQNDGGVAKEIKTSSFDFVQPRAKAKRGSTKRVRSSWVPRLEDTADNSRDFDRESNSPAKEQSPIHSGDNEAEDWRINSGAGAGAGRARVSDNEAMEMDNLRESENERRCGWSEGVRSWLIELGLSRYAPVFEIHEVDDEVLPLLTLEDLRDMGINAVGSRRKLYTAIQKLRRGFS